MASDDKDRRFFLHLINEIVKYANDNRMNADDTIKTVAKWLIVFTDIATLNNYKDYEEGE